MLIGLPLNLVRSILSEWLVPNGLAKLDSAFCNRTGRTRFIEALQGTNTTEVYHFSHKSRHLLSELLRWMTFKCVTTSSFVCFSSNDVLRVAVLHEFISSTAAHLKHVRFVTNDSFMVDLMNSLVMCGCSLESLVIYNGPGNIEREWIAASLKSVLHNSARSLVHLDLVNVQTPIIWKDLLTYDAKFPFLKVLRIRVSGDEDLIRICQAAPNISEIFIPYARCSDVGFAGIGRHWHHLEHLLLKDARSVSNFDAAITALTEGCRKIRVLHLVTCPGLTGVGLLAIASHRLPLVELKISDNNHITESALVALVKSAGETLENVSLAECSRITDTGAKAIVAHCPHLISLLVNYIEVLT